MFFSLQFNDLADPRQRFLSSSKEQLPLLVLAAQLPDSFIRKSDAILTEMSWLNSADAVLATKSEDSFSFVLLGALSTVLRAKGAAEMPLSSLGSSFTSKGGTPPLACPATSGVLDTDADPIRSGPTPSLCGPEQESLFSCGDPFTSVSGISSFTLDSVLRKCWWQRIWSFRLKWREEVKGHSWHWKVSPLSWCWWTWFKRWKIKACIKQSSLLALQKSQLNASDTALKKKKRKFN